MIIVETSNKTKKFKTGAVRSTDADGVRYDLITPIGLRRLAETYKEGSDKYGDWNWLKGLPAGDTLNHTIKHIYQYLSGDRSEDHLAHAAWGLFTVMHFEESNRPELFKDLPVTLVAYKSNFTLESVDNQTVHLTLDKILRVDKDFKNLIIHTADCSIPVKQEYHSTFFKWWVNAQERTPASS